MSLASMEASSEVLIGFRRTTLTPVSGGRSSSLSSDSKAVMNTTGVVSSKSRNLPVKLETAHLGHTDVEDGQVVRSTLQCLQGLGRVRESLDHEPIPLQSQLEDLHDVFVVVHE